MLFWTKDEYLKFADAMMDKPVSYYALKFSTGAGYGWESSWRSLLPILTLGKERVSVTKSYQRLHGEDVVTEPKRQRATGLSICLNSSVKKYRSI
jgi:hypothetical protein